MTSRIPAVVGVVVLLAASRAEADQAAPLSALARMPVKEITVFKDGHAFVLHAGKMPVDASGNVVMDYLPTPVMGTFWPFSADKNAKLSAVVASQRKVLVERTALSIRELLEANVGSAVTITENVPTKDVLVSYAGTLLGLPARSSEELERTSPPGTGQLLPQKGNIVLVRLDEGGHTKAVNIDHIRGVAFKGNVRSAAGQEELRNLLTLKLEWAKKPQNEAEVGMMYVQLGLRWIPSYKITIDGKGNAQVKLEASLVNELTDLEDVTANLVIGVPTFEFKGTPDPISMQQALARLSQYFEQGSRQRDFLSNAAMTQVAYQRAGGERDDRPAMDLGPEVGGTQRSEDLFVFTVNHITLKKGQRMVLPVTEFALKYKDVYKLDVPMVPPPEVWQHFDSSRQAELARTFMGPKVMHNLRLTNDSKYPLTTAPALIMRDDKVLAQGMMTYTAVGAEVDLPITAAVDISVRKSDKEVKRTPNAENWEGNSYNRIDAAGTIRLTNRKAQAVDVEVTRYILGNVGKEPDHGGKAEMISPFEDPEPLGPSGASSLYPYWWGWYNWPYWWRHFNGVGRIKWTVSLKPGETVELNYTWYYLWR